MVCELVYNFKNYKFILSDYIAIIEIDIESDICYCCVSMIIYNVVRFIVMIICQCVIFQ